MSVLATFGTGYPRPDVTKLAQLTTVPSVATGDMTLGAGHSQYLNTSAVLTVDGLNAVSATSDANTSAAFAGGRTWKYTVAVSAGATVSALRYKFAGEVGTSGAVVAAVYINGSNVSGDVSLFGASTYSGTADIDLTSAGSFTSDFLVETVLAPYPGSFQNAGIGNHTGSPGELELSGTVTVAGGYTGIDQAHTPGFQPALAM